MKDLERLRVLLEHEYEQARARQLPGNYNRPSGFMNGLACAMKHIDSLVAQDTMPDVVITLTRGTECVSVTLPCGGKGGVTCQRKD